MGASRRVARRYAALCGLVQGATTVIRVGFALEGQSWLGGINYYRNLLSALTLLPNRKLDPVVFVSRQMPSAHLDSFRQATVVRTSLLDAGTPRAWLRRQTNKVTNHRDPLLGMLA